MRLWGITQAVAPLSGESSALTRSGGEFWDEVVVVVGDGGKEHDSLAGAELYVVSRCDELVVFGHGHDLGPGGPVHVPDTLSGCC